MHLTAERFKTMKIDEIIKDNSMCKELISLAAVEAISNLIYGLNQEIMTRQL